MTDFRLWQLLRAGHFTGEEIIPLLRDLAGWPLGERWPFLGLLFPALTHHVPAVRAAALGALGGAKGRLGLQRLAAGLNDPEPSVRRAAVEGLRESVTGDDWARWVHVLFHADAEVRQAALAEDREFPPPFFYKLFLLPDPACWETVERQLTRARIGVDGLPLFLDLVRRGVLAGPVARRLVGHLTWEEWLGFFGGAAPGSAAPFAKLAEAAWLPGGNELIAADYVPDRLDDVLNLFWEDEPGEDTEPASPGRNFFELLLQGGLAHSDLYRQWFAYTILGVAVQRGIWPAPAAETCAVFAPQFLRCPWVSWEVRRLALAGLYRAGERCPRRTPEEVRTLVVADVCRDAPGRLDLWAVGAVLHLLPANPYQHLLEWVSLTEVTATFWVDPDKAVPFLGLRDNSSRGRNFLIRELCLRPGPGHTRLLALLAALVPADGLDFLGGLDGQAACRVVEHLLALAGTPGGKLSENKTRRLADLLAPNLAAGQVGPFLRAWLDRPAPEDSPLGLVLLGRLARDHEARFLLQAARALEAGLLPRLLKAATCCAGFPYDREIQLARELANHPDDQVRSWAGVRLEEHRTAQTGHGREQPSELALRRGLCDQLRQQPDPVAPNLEYCQSLLASHDPPEQVAEQFARFDSTDPEFIGRLDVAMVAHWRNEMRLPLLGHAWLFRWEPHALALAGLLRERRPQGIAAVLRWSTALASRVLCRRVWEAVARLLEIWRWHDRPRFEESWDEELAGLLVTSLPTLQGDVAASLLRVWWDVAPDAAILEQIRPGVLRRLPDLGEGIRAKLNPWVDSRELPESPSHAPQPEPAGKEILEQILASADLDFLAGCAGGDHFLLAREAARRLLGLGERGAGRLADLLGRSPPPEWPAVVTGTIPDWPEGPALEKVRRLVREKETLPEFRFRAAGGLWQRGETAFRDDLLDAVGTPGPVGWFQEADWDWLQDHFSDQPCALAVRLAAAPHPHAYGPSVRYLLDLGEADSEVRRALLTFLEAGTQRLRELRLEVAEWFYCRGEHATALPLLLQKNPTAEPPYRELLVGIPPDLVDAVVTGVLLAGQGETAEEMVLALLQANGVDLWARDDALGRLLAHAHSLQVRRQARKLVRSGLGRSHKLRRVADTFAWGVRVGRQLTGKLFTLEMIAGEQLGYTRLRENKLYITPMPLLRGQMHAREVVRALILHEYGHHLYHKGEAAEAVWQQAENEGLKRLLNLVSDEHLERNLRALDRGFGDQLKLLAAYAFQHTAREIDVESLLAALRSYAFEVLTATHLGMARRSGCVAVASGRILLQMEKAGLSFARFLRALRMGLGNRHNDPKVALGLELFKGRFRHSSMPELLDRARRLREIFGPETNLLDSLNQEDALASDDEELLEAGEDISDEELQSEIKRSLEGGPRGPGDGGAKGGRGGRGLNLGPEEDFPPITQVVPVPHDPAAHAGYARQVARPARQMRDYLRRLGLGLEPQRFRLRGKSFDRTRARAVVLRGDPRMLVARELRLQTDLFLGVVIDCSGSMASRGNIEKAKLFGTLLAEAARGLRGIDVRLFGFTDRVIYDAGNANRCAVHALEADNGNNDAAALWHAAQAARASRRKAKLLVMISDGSPTECSVAALTALVNRLMRQWKMCCAQVAVCPLEHVCFPNYILLEEDNHQESVRRFGAVVVRLVRQALGALS
jgi:hypothetical protein